MASDDRLTTTVCLCTRDGARFLPEQLDSVLAQDRPVDEVIVGDDASSDATPAMLEKFADSAPMPVRIFRRSEPVGQAANLQTVLTAATGALLFVCDQDDIWHPDKVRLLVSALERHPTFPAAFSNSRLIDNTGRDLGISLWESLGVSAEERQSLVLGSGMRYLARRNPVAGHALAFRRRALDLVLPVPGFVHHVDWWLSLLFEADGGLLPIKETLVDYRQHEGNAVGVRSRRSIRSQLRSMPGAERSARDAELLEAVLGRLAERRPNAIDSEDEAWIRGKIGHATRRAALPGRRTRRVLPVVTELATGGYRRFANGWRSALLDLARNDR
ncbi:MAG: glycosyltransferase [Acidimicrobiales bacterium]